VDDSWQQKGSGKSMTDHAFVTGSASGIGRAIAQKLAGMGYDVTAADNRVDALQDTTAARRVQLDVADAAQVAAVLAEVPPVDLLVNCAGVGLHAPIEYCTDDEVRRIFEINYLGPLRTMRAVLPGMRKRGSGTIVNVTSVAGRAPMVLTGIYGSLKSALDVMSEYLSYELTGTGVRVIVLEPGATRTEFADRRHRVQGAPGYDKLFAGWEQYLQRSLGPGSRAVSPDDVADVLVRALEDPSPAFRYQGSPKDTETLHARTQADEATWRRRIVDQFGLR
jgi:NAD(P)-dependent dehydrogenase (short-subunit alcohol dehydrogenase family)